MAEDAREGPASIWVQVDALCDEFEKHRQAGEKGDIECFLQRIAEPGRVALVRELVLLDASYVRRGGADIDWGSYESRLPQFTSAIQEARQRFEAGETKTVNVGGDVTPRESANLKPGISLPCQFGHYELRDVLGRGAFGTVYRAYDTDLEREVALKIPRFHALTDERDVERFLREARAVAQLKHPSIVAVFDAGEIDGQLYIACELIEGTNLRESLASGERPTCREAAMLLRELAQAVHAAHSRSIIHRDLKPANILLDADGAPHITDFGLARQLEHDTELTSAGIQLGTPAYMSPEQASGHSHLADARSDLWSLGVIFYELLTGRRPFEGSSTELLEAVRGVDPMGLRATNRQIPRDLETICLKCLNRDPEGRYPSAQHLADELTRWMNHEPITARPVSLFERATKWTRRHPARSLSMGVAALVFAGWWIYRETRPAYLDLRVIPSTAAVTLDGTPVRLEDGRALIADAPGRHEIEVAAEGYLPQTRRLSLTRGKDNVMLLNATLESSLGYFRLDSTPTGANVTVGRDGQTLLHGTTPFHSERLSSGEYDITLEKELYRPTTLTIEVPTGDRLARLDAESLTAAVEDTEGHKQLIEYRTLLAREVEFPAFRNTPLQEIREWLVDATKLTFDFDARELEESGISVSTPVTSPGGKMSLRRGLRAILGPSDLTVIPYFESTGNRVMLLITTQERASGMMITTYFPLGKLLDDGVVGSSAALISMITSQVVPQTWERVGGPGSMAFHPDVRALLVSATWDTQLNVLALIDAMRRAKLTDGPSSTTGSEGASLQGHTAIVWCIAASADGKRLASTSGGRFLSNGSWTPAGTTSVPDDTVRVWNLATGRESAKGVGHSNIVKAAAFSIDGKTIFTASIDGSIREWDTGTGKLLREFPGEPGPLNSIAISPDGEQLLTAGSDGHARLWSVEGGSETLRFTGHTKGLWHAMFRPEYLQVASVAADGTLRIWDLEFGDEVQRLEVPKSELQCVDFSPDGNRVVVGGTRGVQSWDLHGTPTQDKQCEVRTNVRAVRFLPDARSAIVACDYGVLLVDTLTGAITHRFEVPIAATQSLCLLPDSRFAAGGHDGVVRIMELPH